MREAYGNTRFARVCVWFCGIASVLGFFLMCEASASVNGPGVAGWLLYGAALLVGYGVTAAYAIKEGLIFVWLVEWKWRKTCAGIGGNFVGEGRQKFHPKLAFDPFSAIAKGEWKRETIHPKLINVTGNFRQFQADIRCFYGQNLDDYTKISDRVAMAFRVRFCSFELVESGLIRMRCGAVQVPEAYEYEPVLQKVPMARDKNYQPWYLAFEGNHTLVVGRTGSGKGSWVWSAVFGLSEARRAGIVRLWGLDPKRVELAYNRQAWDEYSDTLEGMIELLEKAEQDAQDRNSLLQGNARKFTPSPETPLVVIVIDEYAYLSAAVDKKTQDRVQRVMRSLLWLGRSAGYSVFACSQEPRKEVLSDRDYYPTKVALAMEAPMVDLVLGAGAHETAHCDQIPLRDAGAGCGYVKEEMSNDLILVRAAWCSDQQIKNMLLPLDKPFMQVYEQEYGPQLGYDTQQQDEPE